MDELLLDGSWCHCNCYCLCYSGWQESLKRESVVVCGRVMWTNNDWLASYTLSTPSSLYIIWPICFFSDHSKYSWVRPLLETKLIALQYLYFEICIMFVSFVFRISLIFLCLYSQYTNLSFHRNDMDLYIHIYMLQLIWIFS